ncbi:MAG: ABC transporter ATP-binding protein [Thermoplasmata archaeon]|nr:MAG: ABC transporter ATP-binding protein [Thermoplasmata archaeon]
MKKTPGTLIIEATDLHKTYHTGKIQLEALKGVDLSVKAGEMVAIMGPSGCGKTTLLNCLSTLDVPSGGKVLIEGADLSALNEREKADLRANKMGFIFQSYNLLPILSAAENVELPLMVSGHNRNEARAKALEALELVDLTDWAQHKPSELSGGQQQRVTIARSLVNNPIIIWGDEPTGNLDLKNSQQIMKILKKLNNEQGQTYIIVTHDPNIARYADRTIKMESGKIV